MKVFVITKTFWHAVLYNSEWHHITLEKNCVYKILDIHDDKYFSIQVFVDDRLPAQMLVYSNNHFELGDGYELDVNSADQLTAIKTLFNGQHLIWSK